jgi:outer membrane protease
MEDLEFTLIEKEEVASLHFPSEDILKKESEMKARKTSIERAISLGNLEHQKVKIYFSDDKGKKQINTTIWAVTDNAIVLKKNVILPLKRIHKLEI